MPAPSYKPAFDVHVQIASNFKPCMNSTYAITVEDFDTTSDQSGGNEEFGFGVHSRSLNFDMPVDANNDQRLDEGQNYPCVWSDGLRTYTGTVGILTSSTKGGGKGGEIVSYTAKFNGAVVKS